MATRRFFTAILGVLASILACSTLADAAVRPGGPIHSVPSPTYYLVLGASESVGYMPTPTVPTGEPTDLGYANVVADKLSTPLHPVITSQSGCPGVSAQDSVSGATCAIGRASQLDRAVAFVSSHAQGRLIVSIDLGFNDLHPCFAQALEDPHCVVTALAHARTALETILARLAVAAGPSTTFVGLTHDNPFLAWRYHGQAAFAARSTSVIARLNTILRDLYMSHGLVVADVADAFASSSTHPVWYPGLGSIPVNLARVCSWTYSCSPPPLGPNLHPTPQGYRVIATSILHALNVH